MITEIQIRDLLSSDNFPQVALVTIYQLSRPSLAAGLQNLTAISSDLTVSDIALQHDTVLRQLLVSGAVPDLCGIMMQKPAKDLGSADPGLSDGGADLVAELLLDMSGMPGLPALMADKGMIVHLVTLLGSKNAEVIFLHQNLRAICLI